MLSKSIFRKNCINIFHNTVPGYFRNNGCCTDRFYFIISIYDTFIL